MDDPDLSNKEFSTFLKLKGSARHFEDAMRYKFFIAEKFQNGYYGHLFGVSALPRLEPQWDTAYELYEEVTMVLPRSELAGKAMFQKAIMLRADERFEESVETF